MISILINTLAFVVAISVLVAVHEYGHYIVGRWTGMKVLRFSIGFGKPVWKRIGAGEDQTEYCVSAIPLGGYVRFLDSREGPVDPVDEGRAFNQRPVPARIAVLLAGPFFNFLFAMLVYWALFVHGENVARPAIGEVQPGSYAADAGLQFGDRIIAVGDKETSSWESALLAILGEMVSDGRVPLRVAEADGSERVLTIDVGDDKTRLTEPGVLFDGLGFMPWQASSLLGEMADVSSARDAGLQTGDRIVAIDGESVRFFGELRQAVLPRPGETVLIDVDRDGARLSFEVKVGSFEADGQTFGVLGVYAAEDPRDYYYFRQFGVIDSIGEAIARTWDSSIFTVQMIGRMVTGDVSIKNISSPINIAQFAGATAQRGLGDYVAFLAIVSISLGVLNLLPVPVLDGGQIVYQLVEFAKGSPMSDRAQLIGQQIGIFALILLMGFAFFNDIDRILG